MRENFCGLPAYIPDARSLLHPQADGSVAIPCGTYPHKNLQSQAGGPALNWRGPERRLLAVLGRAWQQALPFPDQIVRRPRVALLTWSDCCGCEVVLARRLRDFFTFDA